MVKGLEELDIHKIPNAIKNKIIEGFLYLNATGKEIVEFGLTRKEYRVMRWVIRADRNVTHN